MVLWHLNLAKGFFQQDYFSERHVINCVFMFLTSFSPFVTAVGFHADVFNNLKFKRFWFDASISICRLLSMRIQLTSYCNFWQLCLWQHKTTNYFNFVIIQLWTDFCHCLLLVCTELSWLKLRWLTYKVVYHGLWLHLLCWTGVDHLFSWSFSSYICLELRGSP